MLLSTLSLAALSLSGSTAAPLPTAPTQYLAFIDSLVNSITRGEGGLKQTCYQVYHTNEATTFIEKEQCKKAMKEVEFAKKQYPKALNFVTKYQPIDSNSSLQNQLTFVAEASAFTKACTDERNIRAAKTMRYWGTDEVGTWKYKNLSAMGASQYQLILDACSSGSWVGKKKKEVTTLLKARTSNNLSNSGVATCKAAPSQEQWTSQLQATNERHYQQNRDALEALTQLERYKRELSSVLGTFSGVGMYERERELTKATSYCKLMVTTGTNALAEQKRAKQRAIIAKQEAERRQREAYAAQQRAAAQAERQRQQRVAAQAEQQRQQRLQQKAAQERQEQFDREWSDRTQF